MCWCWRWCFVAAPLRTEAPHHLSQQNEVGPWVTQYDKIFALVRWNPPQPAPRMTNLPPLGRTTLFSAATRGAFGSTAYHTSLGGIT